MMNTRLTMKNILDAFKNLLPANQAKPGTSINLITNKKAILKALRNSMETGRVIGIYSRLLGNGMLLVGVEDITNYKSEDVIILTRYDQSGLLLHSTRLLLSEIICVCPFESKYVDPIKEKKSGFLHEEESIQA